jgi:iron complex transport system substrate-binding protein
LLEAPALAQMPGWNRISAVKSGRVYGVDGNALFNRSGPRMVDTLELLAHLIHPNRCAPPVSLRSLPTMWQPLSISESR